MPSERLCAVQFIHPGGEHGSDRDGFKGWNLDAHKRKFLRQPGTAVDESGGSRESELIFWGEWEPESDVEAIPRPMPEGPRWVHQPFYSDPPPPGWRQNTDPFVFGDTFHYTGCKQYTSRGPTQLRFLRRGSLVLFGSRVAGTKFVLDTAFVVADYIDHSRSNHRRVLDGRISDTYRAATIAPWYSGSGGDESYRLYSGATLAEPLRRMFSFFPASTPERHPHGFARPEVRIPGLITSHLSQGQRLNPQPSIREVEEIFDEVVSQVRTAGLLLGVTADLPKPVLVDRSDERSKPPSGTC